MAAVFRFIRSLKVTIVLLGFIAALSILATIIPQNRETAFYLSRYGNGGAAFILALGLYNIFRSLLFYVLIGLFACNLTACSVYRMVKRFTSNLPLRIGPDIIHLSLLIFITAGVVSVSGRKEAFTYVRSGDTLELPKGERIYVTELEEVTYKDGRPKGWYTRVRYGAAADITNEYSIEVNHPLKISGYTFYQETFGSRPVTRLGITGQEDVYLREGEAIGILRFDGITAESEVVFSLLHTDGEKQIAAAPGDVIAEMEADEIRLLDIRMETISGLKIVRDPSYIPIVIAFLLLSAGLVLTFFQKMRDRQKGDEII